MTSKSRGHCDNIKVFNQGKSNQMREKSGNLIAKNVWPPCSWSTCGYHSVCECPTEWSSDEVKDLFFDQLGAVTARIPGFEFRIP